MLGVPRDPASIRERLTGWLAARRPGAAGLRLSLPVTPKVGFSNETFLCDAEWTEGRVARRESLVVRLAPQDFHVFPAYDLERQFRIMQRLAESDVPVPRVLAWEPDPGVLGSPFYVMERIAGEVPSEVPCYHAAGFCLEATPERRARVWWSGVDALARVHRADWRALGLDFLGVPGEGTDPLDRQLAHYADYLEWVRQGSPQPVLEAALAWLRAHRYVPRRVRLCWGDSRLPNLIFRDDAVAGVLDWEMAFLGDPEADLGWWLFLDWAQSEGYGIPRLPGFPGAEETVRRWEALTGWPAEHLLWQEVFAAFRFGAIMARIAGRLKALGMPTPSEDFERDNVCTRRLAALLGLPAPGASGPC
jgi:aminoglycoside phosphotransferase (APT) family kinase protein